MVGLNHDAFSWFVQKEQIWVDSAIQAKIGDIQKYRQRKVHLQAYWIKVSTTTVHRNKSNRTKPESTQEEEKHTGQLELDPCLVVLLQGIDSHA